MTTLRQIDLCCPSCTAQFSSSAVVSTNAFGGKRTDFHERAAGTQPLPYQVHVCLRCGYSGTERDFSEPKDVTPFVREHIWNELSPLVSANMSGSEKYSAAARVAEWQGADERHVGDLWLRAAWCCVDEDDIEAERYYRRYAAWSFEKALLSYDVVPADDRAVLVYLVGEIWRRVGEVARAVEWFNRVADEVVDEDSQQWILEAASRQRTDPREWFG